ncbi:MAG TPA: GNAT family N-acetyltransferase [Actinospica sp.]|jgi:ribosomal protein S18 acetylase RimI-like enzyme|nr:GNAT family N-acetyltransferase [Actinospica sp.]
MTSARPPRISAEELFAVAASCWGYLEAEALDGWELRAGAGFTNRANSVWPIGPLRRPLTQALDEVRAWYAERGLSAQVAVEIGSDFDLALAEHGCGDGHDDAFRQTAPIAPALELLASHQHPNVPVSTADRPQDRWLRLYRAGSLPPQAKAILGSGERYRYATIYDESTGEPLAIGRAALAAGSESWVGLAGIETAPSARRRGLARLILSVLISWAAEQGAEYAVLEVRRTNDAALALYQQLGFVTAHEYHYRTIVEAATRA